MKKKGPKTIVQGHKGNFETLRQAFLNGDVALMECFDKQLKEKVAVICAVKRVGEEFELVPFARFFNGNPYEILISAIEEG